MTRGLAEDGVLRKEKIEPDDPRRRTNGVLPFEFTVTWEAREVIEEHIDTRVKIWGFDASDLWTLDEAGDAFFR